MNMLHKFLALSLFSYGLVACATTAEPTNSVCQSKDKSAPVLAIAECLGDADPAIRDGFAYETLAARLRRGELGDGEVQALGDQLLAYLSLPDPAGFRRPFAALVLSEIARVDRISPYMTDAERQAMVDNAGDYLTTIEDYRGFDDGQGWRHGVAHGADWLMQLALNPALSKDQAQQILAAVAAQAGVSGHTYVHGESARLARPVLFITQHGFLSEEDWTAWFETLADPAPMTDWAEAFSSEAGLAKRQNLTGFLSALYVAGDSSGSDAFEPMRAGLLGALRTLP